jgi:hypothetical protein
VRHGSRFLVEFGIDLSTLRPARCYLPALGGLDRATLAHRGAVGAAITKRCFEERCFELGWMERMKRSQAMVVTPLGRRGLRKTLGIDAAEAGAHGER